ncbi:aldose 1-epimerase family protein [Cellulomonas fengjieae]|uniref:aldose 1-epimerase family protein n=1 Tax=Cellulomonas fengjieae TaxID=2819978 RepID=UPI001AAF1A76|nr:aldose 1-epimerase family protein [Cellulomonas fengjieae]MBO3100983.1 aldose 1-epimerase family protein [Cellulomonas fengjieae]
MTRTREVRQTAHLVHLASPDGRSHATVDLRGGGLHSLEVDGEPLVHTYDADGPVPYCAGSLLFPWPNRVRGGHWAHDGIEHQLEVDEPELGNANHGFVREATFQVTSRSARNVTVATVVEPRPGYPFEVALSTTYTAQEAGVRVDHTICNLSPAPAPVALGAHPYVRVGTVPADELRLTVLADRHLPVDAALIPVRDEPVDASVDLRDGRLVAGSDLNTCYHDLTAQDGEHRHHLAAPDGRAIEVWTDRSFGHVQVYVTDRFPQQGQRTTAIAVEPMTAAPDALNSGRGLRWLAAGQSWDLSWGLRALAW